MLKHVFCLSCHCGKDADLTQQLMCPCQVGLKFGPARLWVLENMYETYTFQVDTEKQNLDNASNYPEYPNSLQDADERDHMLKCQCDMCWVEQTFKIYKRQLSWWNRDLYQQIEHDISSCLENNFIDVHGDDCIKFLEAFVKLQHSSNAVTEIAMDISQKLNAKMSEVCGAWCCKMMPHAFSNLRAIWLSLQLSAHLCQRRVLKTGSEADEAVTSIIKSIHVKLPLQLRREKQLLPRVVNIVTNAVWGGNGFGSFGNSGQSQLGNYNYPLKDGQNAFELEPDLVLCGEGSQQNHQVSASMSRLLESVSLDNIIAFVMMNPSIAFECADSVFEVLKETMERNFEAKYMTALLKMQQKAAK